MARISQASSPTLSGHLHCLASLSHDCPRPPDKVLSPPCSPPQAPHPQQCQLSPCTAPSASLPRLAGLIQPIFNSAASFELRVKVAFPPNAKAHGTLLVYHTNVTSLSVRADETRGN